MFIIYIVYILMLFFLLFRYKSVIYSVYASIFLSLVLFLYASYKLYNFSNVFRITNSITSKNFDKSVVDFFSLQLDGVALSLVWLTTFVILLSVLYVYNVSGFGVVKHNFLLIFLEFLLIFSFTVKNLFNFYIFFESVLIPMFLLIGLGSRGRKIHAKFFFFFFTFVSSILLLIGISFIFFIHGTLTFDQFVILEYSLFEQKVIFLLFFFGFAAKIPLIPVHIWLPEAHVEAPTIGSVILAAILLKLGAYGLYRVIFPICNVFLLNFYIIPYICLSLILTSLIASRIIDLKKIVAYSSVVHMSFALLGLLTTQHIGVQGFLFLLISHGFISAGMFFCVGMLYDRFHTRNVFYYGGLVQYMPLFAIFYFFIIFSNMSLPGTCNFIGEFLVLFSLYESFGLGCLIISLVGLFSTVLFCLVLVYKVLFYQISGFLVYNLIDLTLIEFLILFILSIYILMFGLFPNLLLNFYYI